MLRWNFIIFYASHQIWAVRGLSHLGDLMFCEKTLHERKRDAWVGTLSWWSCQSPVAHSCGLLNHLNSFHGGMPKLNAKFDADPLFYSLSHCECNSHTVHMLTQCRLPPPLTSPVKSSLFIHVHSSPLSLAARLHQRHANCSDYINKVGLFPNRPHIFLQSSASVQCGLKNRKLHYIMHWALSNNIRNELVVKFILSGLPKENIPSMFETLL